MARVLGELSYNYRKSPIVREDGNGSAYSRGEARHPRFVDCREFAAGPHAGDRAPDALDGRGPERSDVHSSRLSDLLRGGTYALLLFEGTHGKQEPERAWPTAKALAQELQRRHGGIIKAVVVTPRQETPRYMDWNGPVVHDGEGTFHDRYGARGECLYLIRPDGYIAYRSQPIEREKLEHYLAEIG